MSLVGHLWQSTVFLLAAAALVRLVGPDHPTLRYRIWLAASLKFLLPISLLAVPARRVAEWLLPPVVVSPVTTVGQPSTVWTLPVEASARPDSAWLVPFVIGSVWLVGSVVVLGMRLTQWRHVRRAVADARVLAAGRERDALERSAARLAVRRPVRLLGLSSRLEPGVVGWRRPRLLWPAGLSAHLTDAQLDAVVTHETAHISRADNLHAALQVVVEALFWFHPLVWWVSGRLVDERERACDEVVLGSGSHRHTYAEALLVVCRYCLRSPAPAVAAATRSNLSQRVETIMTYRRERSLGTTRRAAVVAAALLVAAWPVVTGVMNAEPAVIESAPAVTSPTAERDSAPQLPPGEPPAAAEDERQTEGPSASSSAAEIGQVTEEVRLADALAEVEAQMEATVRVHEDRLAEIQETVDAQRAYASQLRTEALAAVEEALERLRTEGDLSDQLRQQLDAALERVLEAQQRLAGEEASAAVEAQSALERAQRETILHEETLHARQRAREAAAAALTAQYEELHRRAEERVLQLRHEIEAAEAQQLRHLTEEQIAQLHQEAEAVVHEQAVAEDLEGGTFVADADADAAFRQGAWSTDTPGLEAPTPIRTIQPAYSAEAMDARIEGTVVVEVVVSPAGTVGRARIVGSLDREHGLDERALAAARGWVFEPGRLDGERVPVLVSLDMEFRLD